MRNVSMPIAWIVDILEPLLQLAMFSNAIGGNLRPQFHQLVTQPFIDTEHPTSSNRVVEKIANDLMVHGWPHDQPTLLWRIARATNQPAMLVS